MKKNNQRGSISLLGALLTTILSLFLLFLVLKMQVEYREAINRKKTYLCFKYLTHETENYISLMTKFNWAVRTAFLAQASVIASKEAKITFESLVKMRNLSHISYMKNLLKNNYCSYPESGTFVKNTPYKTLSMFLLETNKDQTTKLKAREWKNTIVMKPNKIRSSHIFGIAADFSLDGEFLPNFHYKSKEVGIKALLNLNPLFGSQSSLF